MANFSRPVDYPSVGSGRFFLRARSLSDPLVLSFAMPALQWRLRAQAICRFSRRREAFTRVFRRLFFLSEIRLSAVARRSRSSILVSWGPKPETRVNPQLLAARAFVNGGIRTADFRAFWAAETLRHPADERTLTHRSS